MNKKYALGYYYLGSKGCGKSTLAILNASTRAAANDWGFFYYVTPTAQVPDVPVKRSVNLVPVLPDSERTKFLKWFSKIRNCVVVIDDFAAVFAGLDTSQKQEFRAVLTTTRQRCVEVHIVGQTAELIPSFAPLSLFGGVFFFRHPVVWSVVKPKIGGFLTKEEYEPLMSLENYQHKEFILN